MVLCQATESQLYKHFLTRGTTQADDCIWERYFESTLRKGFVKSISFNDKELFILTEKGETLQDFGSIEKYEKHVKWKKFIENAKEIVVIIVTPLIAFLAVISTALPYFKKDQPLEIKQPIILHIDNLGRQPQVQNDTNNSRNQSKSVQDSTNNMHP